MDAPTRRVPATAAPPGLVESVRLLAGSLVGSLSARLELLGLESREAAANYLRVLVLAVVALIGLVFGYFFLVLGLAFLVQAGTGWSWVTVTAAFGAAHLAVAVFCAFSIKTRLATPAFTESLAELRKDRDWLNRDLSTSATDSPRR